MSNSSESRNERLRTLLGQAVQCLSSDGSVNVNSASSNSSLSLPGTSCTSTPLGRERVWQREGHIERNSLFNYKRKTDRKGKGPSHKKKRVAKWNHEFICLAKKDQSKTPSAMERSVLITAGLGRKAVSCFEFGDADDLDDELVSAFPKLKDCGGYELLRVVDKSRLLEVIPVPPDGYTAKYLKAVVLQARVYIRPIQRDLSTEPVATVGLLKVEKCLACGEAIPVKKLRSHRDSCEGVVRENEKSPIWVRESSNSSDNEDEDLFPSSGLLDPPTPKVNQDADATLTENVMVDYALTLSSAKGSKNVELPKNLKSVSAVLKELKKELIPELYEFQVRRGHVLEDLLRETRQTSFNPLRRVKTWFIGELGKDTGGVSREMWSLFAQEVMTSLCEGSEGRLVFRNDSSKVKNGDFKRVGMLVGMSLVQGGSGLSFFAPSLFEYVSGRDVCNISPSIEEIPDVELQTTLGQLTEASEDSEVRSIALGASSMLIDNGISKALALLQVEDVPHIVNSVALYATILKIKAILDQFMAGLDEAGVLKAIKAYPSFFKSLFIRSEEHQITAEYILRLLSNKVFSSAGSSALIQEQTTYIYFKDVLNEIESGASDISLGIVLSFFTGSSHPPPMGFTSEATLTFNAINPYPTASTCGLSLTLPSKYTEYVDFKDHFIYGMLNHGGFGLY